MANRYWVGGAAAWDSTAGTKWALTSGGAGGQPIPTSADDVFFDAASGAVTVTGNVTATVNSLNFTGFTGTFSPSGSFTINSSLTFSAAMTLSSTASWTMAGTGTLTSNGKTLNSSVTIAASAGTVTLGSALTTAALFINSGTLNTGASSYSVTASNPLRINGGTLTANASTLSTAIFTYLSGTVNAGTSQINCTGNTITSFAGGGRTYYNVSFTSTILATGTVTGANTFTNLTVSARTSAVVTKISFSANQTITGTLTVPTSTTAAGRTFMLSDVAGTPRTLTAAAVSLTNVDFQDITAAGAASPFTGTRLGNCKGNTNITFPAAKTVYWNLAAGGLLSANAWATTGGGSPSLDNFPLAQDTAIFQSTGLNSGATVTVNFGYNIGTLDMSARTANTMTLATGSTTPTIYGNWLNGTGTTLTGTGQITFGTRGSQTITAAGITFTTGITLDSRSGTLTLQDSIATSSATAGAFTLTNGTLNLNGNTLTLSAAATATFLTAAGTKNITFNGGTILVAASGATAFDNAAPTNFTTTAGTGTGTISLTSASAKTFVGGSGTYNCAINQGGSGTLTFTGANTFSDITNTYGSTGATTIRFPASTTTTVSNFTASGTPGNLLTIDSSTAGTRATLSKASGIVNVSSLNIKDSAAAGGATWNAINSVNGGNNTGWTFITLSTNNLFLLLM